MRLYTNLTDTFDITLGRAEFSRPLVEVDASTKVKTGFTYIASGYTFDSSKEGLGSTTATDPFLTTDFGTTQKEDMSYMKQYQ